MTDNASNDPYNAALTAARHAAYTTYTAALADAHSIPRSRASLTAALTAARAAYDADLSAALEWAYYAAYPSQKGRKQ